MKRLFFYLMASMALVGCQQKEPAAESSRQMEFYASIGENETGTKTILNNEVDVWWCPFDSIRVFQGTLSSGKFTSTNFTPTAKATFKGTMSQFIGGLENEQEDVYFWGVSPYQSLSECDGQSVTVSVPETQIATPGSFQPGTFPSVARSTSSALTFYNVCGGVKFVLQRDDITSITFESNGGEPIAGTIKVGIGSDGKPFVSEVIEAKSKVSLEAKPYETLNAGTSYMIALLPGTLNSGFTVTYETRFQRGQYKVTAPITIKRATFGTLTCKDAGLQFEDYLRSLGEDEAANCYLIDDMGHYCIPAVMGNSSEPVTGAVKAEVIWETFNTTTAPSVGDIVSSIYYFDGHVYFTTTGTDGNALIAVKSSSGEILWSWHIWAVKGYQPEPLKILSVGTGNYIMERNLGALTNNSAVTSFGFLYQWGRKDPLFGSGEYIAQRSCTTLAAATATPPIAVKGSDVLGSEANNLSYSIANPMTLIGSCTGGSSSTYDWFAKERSKQNSNLWSNSKTMYDPCPAGWHVASTETLSSSMVSASSGIHPYAWKDATILGVTAGLPHFSPDFFLPAPGERNSDSCSYVGTRLFYWSSTVYTYQSRILQGYRDDTYKDVKIYINQAYSRSYALPVRCQKDNND